MSYGRLCEGDQKRTKYCKIVPLLITILLGKQLKSNHTHRYTLWNENEIEHLQSARHLTNTSYGFSHLTLMKTLWGGFIIIIILYFTAEKIEAPRG